ncbi:MAG: hypothetical protein ABW049_01945 [Spongiibacteraceae bacterium]
MIECAVKPVTDLALVGSAAQVEDRLGELQRAGIDEYLAIVAGNDHEQQATLELLARNGKA